MAQHDYDIANQTFPSFRSDLNSVLEAINTSNSGTSRPTSAVAGTIWLDTTNATNPTLKLYDGADDISLATFDYSANTVNWIDSTVVFDIVNDTTPQLGGNLDVNGNSIVSVANGNITFTPDGTGKVVISGLSFPTSDGTSGQAIVTDGCGNLSFASIEGRTGTVNWDTTAKTASFTAVSGNGYFVNTTSGSITVTLPAGSAGSIISLKDYANTWDTNNVTITPNGTDKINGVNANANLNTEDQSVTLVYVDSTKGWRVVQDSTSSVTGSAFILATGGTITCCGNYKIHTFTSPGTFTVSSTAICSSNNILSYMVVAGGGAGGGADAGTNGGAGGGGAGGFREYKSSADCYTASPLDGNPCGTAITVTATSYPIVIGGGGAGNDANQGSSGSNSTFSTITSTGGGGGGARTPSPSTVGYGLDGGSGGGASYGDCPGTNNVEGSGNTPPVTPPQGNNGADYGGSSNPGGGGGATVAGSVGTAPGGGGDGGDGATTSISGTPTAYAGGGGGAAKTSPPPGTGGIGGGGDGVGNNPGNPGTINTGGGGGGGSGCGSPTNSAGGNGGSGIVIIRYKYQ